MLQKSGLSGKTGVCEISSTGIQDILELNFQDKVTDILNLPVINGLLTRVWDPCAVTPAGSLFCLGVVHLFATLSMVKFFVLTIVLAGLVIIVFGWSPDVSMKRLLPYRPVKDGFVPNPYAEV